MHRCRCLLAAIVYHSCWQDRHLSAQLLRITCTWFRCYWVRLLVRSTLGLNRSWNESLQEDMVIGAFPFADHSAVKFFQLSSDISRRVIIDACYYSPWSKLPKGGHVFSSVLNPRWETTYEEPIISLTWVSTHVNKIALVVLVGTSCPCVELILWSLMQSTLAPSLSMITAGGQNFYQRSRGLGIWCSTIHTLQSPLLLQVGTIEKMSSESIALCQP